MDFAEELANYSAADLIELLGCPRRTAYNWKNSERMPPEWLQPIILDVLSARRKVRDAKKKADR